MFLAYDSYPRFLMIGPHFLMSTRGRNMEPIEQNIGFSETTNKYSGRGESTFSQVKSTVADKLHSAAKTLHQTAERGNQQSGLSSFGHRAAGWLDNSASYVSEVEPERMRRDLEDQVRNNPGRSLLIAGAVGLVLGGILRRR
jgi:ElaB/YqjD/DUF883 family membrane-anchored ribosome-binding protein